MLVDISLCQIVWQEPQHCLLRCMHASGEKKPKCSRRPTCVTILNNSKLCFIASLISQSAEVNTSAMNYYSQVQFKHLSGQPTALEIWVIFLDGKLSLLEIPALYLQLFSEAMWGNEGKLEHRRFLLNISKKAFAVRRVITNWTRILRGYGISVLGDTKNLIKPGETRSNRSLFEKFRPLAFRGLSNLLLWVRVGELN